MQKLNSTEQFNQLKMDENVIFLFTAGWCPDCRVIEPVLPEIEEMYQDFQFIEVNRDDYIELAQEENIFGIPSFLAFMNGKEVGRFVSKDRKTKEEIIQFIDDFAK